MSVDLLVVGRDGNGKSSTGNSILGGKFFNPSSSSVSVGVDIKIDKAAVNDVTVTEVSGLEYPSIDNPGDVEATFTTIETACQNGFSAVLIVLKYGVRFTRQEQEALMMIKSVFGPDVVKDHGVIVMTYGDSFYLDMEDDGQTFEDWCKKQTEEIQTLFDECERRCVLFNNRIKDETALKDQREKLLTMVHDQQEKVGRYTENKYKMAESSRTKLAVQSKLPKLQIKTRSVLNDIWERLDHIGQENRAEPANIFEDKVSLENLQKELTKLKEDLKQEDKDTKVLSQLLSEMAVTEKRIEIKLKTVEQKINHAHSEDKPWVVFFHDNSEFSLECFTEVVDIRVHVADGGDGMCQSGSSSLDEYISNSRAGSSLVLVEIRSSKKHNSTDIYGYSASAERQKDDLKNITEESDHSASTETQNDDLENTKVTFTRVNEFLKLNPHKFNNNMIIILEYGLHFTKQEIDSVMMKIKSTFGSSRVENNSMLILTHEDRPDLDIEKGQMFDWCNNQTLVYRDLLDAYNNRWMILNTRTRDEKTVNSQNDMFRSVVAEMLSKVAHP